MVLMKSKCTDFCNNFERWILVVCHFLVFFPVGFFENVAQFAIERIFSWETLSDSDVISCSNWYFEFTRRRWRGWCSIRTCNWQRWFQHQTFINEIQFIDFKKIRWSLQSNTTAIRHVQLLRNIVMLRFNRNNIIMISQAFMECAIVAAGRFFPRYCKSADFIVYISSFVHFKSSTAMSVVVYWFVRSFRLIFSPDGSMWNGLSHV